MMNLPFVKIYPQCILHYVTAEHLSTYTVLFSWVWGKWGGGLWCLHISPVLNSLMQFSNATYSFHVSLEAFTCEIATASRSLSDTAPQRQGHTEAPDVGGRAKLIATHCSVGVYAPSVN